MEDTFQVPNLVRGLQVIEYLIDQETPQSITQIANGLGVPKNSVLRIVNALGHYGYVHRDPDTKACRMTRKLFAMAYSMPHEKTLIESSREAMTAVRDAFRETVVLSVLEGNRGIILEQIQGLHPFRFVCEPGTEQQLHSSASTKAILALLPEAECEALLDSLVFEQFTDATITSPAALRQELVTIRDRGFAFDLGEQIDGVHCVASAIRNHRGAPVAAITMTGPSTRVRPLEHMEEIGRFIEAQALCVSRYLGFEPALELEPLPT